jgi:hypothetical protein
MKRSNSGSATVDEKGNIMAGSGGHVAGVKRTNSDMQQVRVTGTALVAPVS